jgi:two-component system alkaline phosphatase synthesis response regulator PhoP
MDKKKILLVEDDEFLSEILSGKLKEAGFEVNLANNAPEGLNLTKSIKFDLILLDLILPGMDGFEFLKIFKGEPNNSSAPVVVLSNLGQEEEIKRAKILGAEDFMIKAHHTTKEIIEKIKKIL